MCDHISRVSKQDFLLSNPNPAGWTLDQTCAGYGEKNNTDPKDIHWIYMVGIESSLYLFFLKIISKPRIENIALLESQYYESIVMYAVLWVWILFFRFNFNKEKEKSCTHKHLGYSKLVPICLYDVFLFFSNIYT